MCSSRLLFRLSLKAESKWAKEVKKQSRLAAGATLIFFRLKKAACRSYTPVGGILLKLSFGGTRDAMQIILSRRLRCSRWAARVSRPAEAVQPCSRQHISSSRTALQQTAYQQQPNSSAADSISAAAKQLCSRQHISSSRTALQQTAYQQKLCSRQHSSSMLYQQQPNSSATDSIAAVAEQLCSRQHALAAAEKLCSRQHS